MIPLADFCQSKHVGHMKQIRNSERCAANVPLLTKYLVVNLKHAGDLRAKILDILRVGNVVGISESVDQSVAIQLGIGLFVNQLLEQGRDDRIKGLRFQICALISKPNCFEFGRKKVRSHAFIFVFEISNNSPRLYY